MASLRRHGGVLLCATVLVAAACVVVQQGEREKARELEAKGAPGVLIGNIFSPEKAAALKSFDAGAFDKMLHGTEAKLSGAVSAGMQGVAAAKKQIKKVEAAAAPQSQTQPMTAAHVEKAIHQEQAALDKTHEELSAVQKAINTRTTAMLQHHRLEKEEELHLKGKETDADYSRNIDWDKKDMLSTKVLTAKIDHLSKLAQVQQKALNADFAMMLKLEQADEEKHGVHPAKQSLKRLAAKDAASHASADDKAQTSPAATATHAKFVQGPVPPVCLALRVVKGVVSVPEQCMKYALVRQVLGEAKTRGGVRYAVSK